ncbi:hypothetical protein K474DRAFT_363138 [Panus rudis PR-1116 ss-1]|nr:hypothetical protein K474DRAFT_363138 [Panus rudis PR-1116 ss-1]
MSQQNSNNSGGPSNNNTNFAGFPDDVSAFRNLINTAREQLRHLYDIGTQLQQLITDEEDRAEQDLLMSRVREAADLLEENREEGSRTAQQTVADASRPHGLCPLELESLGYPPSPLSPEGSPRRDGTADAPPPTPPPAVGPTFAFGYTDNRRVRWTHDNPGSNEAGPSRESNFSESRRRHRSEPLRREPSFHGVHHNGVPRWRVESPSQVPEHLRNWRATMPPPPPPRRPIRRTRTPATSQHDGCAGSSSNLQAGHCSSGSSTARVRSTQRQQRTAVNRSSQPRTQRRRSPPPPDAEVISVHDSDDEVAQQASQTQAQDQEQEQEQPPSEPQAAADASTSTECQAAAIGSSSQTEERASSTPLPSSPKRQRDEDDDEPPESGSPSKKRRASV